jgi:tetratricopeptide (TPR) repeat protein
MAQDAQPAQQANSANPAEPPPNPLTQVEQWYRSGQFQQAAEQGLQDLLEQPWNHELRFMVADSLQRIGQTDQAMAQFEALDGTPLAASAALRLTAMRNANGAANNAVKRVPDDGATRPLPALPRAAPPGIKAAASAVPALGIPAGTATVAAAQADDAAEAAGSAKNRPASTLRARVLLPKKPAMNQKIDELAAKGDYEAVAKQGLRLLEQERNNHDLRLLVANSLAWTGFLDQAIVQYQQLQNTPLAQDANIGLANALRWKGQDADALPLYQAVLMRTPDNAAAREGLQLAQRELRPRTIVTVGKDQDSSGSQRRAVVVEQSWRDQSGKHWFAVEAAGANDKLLGLRQNERDVALRYQALGWPLQPKIELDLQANPQRDVFGNLRLHFGSAQNYLDIGRVNWGKMASNAKALQAGLSANHVGVAYSGRSQWGELGARLDYYGISDDNEIITSGLRFVPAWRPLGSHVKLFAGIETRDARRGAINGSYWAPVDGFGIGFAGLQADFGAADWSLYSSGQVGGRLYGEAANNWAFSVGGKRWLGQDWALGVNFFKLASTRDNSSYRAKSLNMSLEKLWN